MTPQAWEDDYRRVFEEDQKRQMYAECDAEDAADDEPLGGYAFPDEVEYADYAESDYQPCACPYCGCSMPTRDGQCWDCRGGMHQG